MLFVNGVVGILLIGFLLFCLLDVITSDPGDIRHLPKIGWLLLVVLLNPIGGVAWLIAGRPRPVTRPGGLPYKGNTGTATSTGRTRGFADTERPRRVIAPDDDPEFLANLERGNTEHERMLGNWEDDLRRREEELRRREREDGDGT